MPGMLHVTRALLTAAFAGSVVAANWLLNRYGVIPVGFGLEAPAGVLAAGLAFGLRDALHEVAGRAWVVGAILAGSTISLYLESAATIPGGRVSIAVASAVAFLLSELVDLAVYSPLRARHWPVAVAVSNVAGAVVDSALFLWLAFGSLELMAGQVWGKTLMIAVALPIVWGARRALPRNRIRPASA